jgi:IS605 OrfB family transposase
MTTLTYCKGLPTPLDEMTLLGFTQMEIFLTEYATIFRLATIETVDHLLQSDKFNKSKWNTHLQLTHKINKRHANGVISYSKGLVDGAKENQQHHIKILQGKIKSIESWLIKAERKLKLARKFYSKKSWQSSKTGCKFPLSCSLKYKTTNWQNLRFQIHNKKRKLYLLKNKLEYLKQKPIYVSVPHSQVFVVGSKDETYGNQACQWDRNNLKFRVPACLESKFGKYVTSRIGDFDRNINRLPNDGSKTWHFYRKDNKWCVAVQFTPSPVKPVSRQIQYGCIGIDLNPGSIGWSYVDHQGNLKAKGKIPLLMGLPKGKQDAQIVDACLKLAQLALKYACPIVCEELDFRSKKERLGEACKKYARMLSSWAYSRFYELLQSILNNRGIELITVNPAYTSVIGLVKYLRIYGLSSDTAAGIAIARRGMRLSERLPSAINAYLSVNDEKHDWHWWNKLNTLLKKSGVRRYTYYSISNWESQVNQLLLEVSNDA